MGFAVKDIIWSFFGLRDTVSDINPDINGRGLNQRFNELLAGDFDENDTDKINNLVSYTQYPSGVLSKFLHYRENTFNLCLISTDEYVRRKFIEYARQINMRRGTKWGYILLFRFMGFDGITITEFGTGSGFDSPVTFDDADRVFDLKCVQCSSYSIDLTGSFAMTDEIIKFIGNVIEYNEPINAKLRDVTYNGGSIISTLENILLTEDLGYLLQEDLFSITL